MTTEPWKFTVEVELPPDVMWDVTPYLGTLYGDAADAMVRSAGFDSASLRRVVVRFEAVAS